MTNTTNAYEMTTSQRITLNRFIDFVTYTDNYEVKELEVKDSYGDAYVSVTMGIKNDEGTMAELLCRDTYIFFIGRRGGIFQYTDTYRKAYRKYYQVEKLNI